VDVSKVLSTTQAYFLYYEQQHRDYIPEAEPIRPPHRPTKAQKQKKHAAETTSRSLPDSDQVDPNQPDHQTWGVTATDRRSSVSSQRLHVAIGIQPWANPLQEQCKKQFRCYKKSRPCTTDCSCKGLCEQQSNPRPVNENIGAYLARFQHDPTCNEVAPKIKAASWHSVRQLVLYAEVMKPMCYQLKLLSQERMPDVAPRQLPHAENRKKKRTTLTTAQLTSRPDWFCGSCPPYLPVGALVRAQYAASRNDLAEPPGQKKQKTSNNNSTQDEPIRILFLMFARGM
jgi:hypothetical protein